MNTFTVQKNTWRYLPGPTFAMPVSCPTARTPDGETDPEPSPAALPYIFFTTKKEFILYYLSLSFIKQIPYLDAWIWAWNSRWKSFFHQHIIVEDSCCWRVVIVICYLTTIEWGRLPFRLRKNKGRSRSHGQENDENGNMNLQNRQELIYNSDAGL